MIEIMAVGDPPRYEKPHQQKLALTSPTGGVRSEITGTKLLLAVKKKKGRRVT
jgi:hypothetical protein